MTALSIGGRRSSFALAFAAAFALVLIELTSAPESPGLAPAPVKEKDKYDRAIDRGLEWLALHQANDGHWSLHEFHKHAREKPLPNGKTFVCNCEADMKTRNDLAATALGLLPFLATGHGPKASAKKPDYSKTVEAGLKYLLAKQAKDGSFGANAMYAHALAARALCDAYALTKEDKLKEPAQKAVDFIVAAQDPVGGGWRYQPKQPGDLSVTGWQFAALKRGQLAGLIVPGTTWKMTDKFLDTCEIAPGGEFAYVPGSGASPSMTAVGLLCRQYIGVGPKNPALQKGVRNLKAHPPGKTDNLYYLYYANQVMYNLQGDIWRSWDTGLSFEGERIHPGMRNWLLDRQDKGDGAAHPHQIGSWSGSQGGRIMATSLSLLILEQVKQQPLYRHKAAIGE